MSDPTPQAPLLPWKLAFLLIGVVALCMVAGSMLAPHGAGAAVAGVMTGLLGGLFGSARHAALAALSALAAMAIVLGVGVPEVNAAVAVLLVALIAAEARHDGGRNFVFALFSATILLLGTAEPSLHAVPAYLFGAAVGIGLVLWRGLSGKARGQPSDAGHAAGLLLFMLIGVACTVYLVRQSDNPKAYWVAMIFAMRGLAPPGAQVPTILRHGLGTVIGAALAALLIWLGMQGMPRLALALAAFVLGLRFALVPKPTSTALFTFGLLLAGTGPLADAGTRVLAVSIVATLTVALAWLIGAAGRLLNMGSR